MDRFRLLHEHLAAASLCPQVEPATSASAEAEGGIALLEHVNVNHSATSPADTFFFDLLGMVPAAYCSDTIIHANFGLSQMHVPIQPDSPQTWSGTIGLAYSRDA